MANEKFDDLFESDPIHEVMDLVRASIYLQIAGEDVAIPYLQGPPGIAKTSLTAKLAKDNNMFFAPEHFGQLPYEEVSGLPEYVDVEFNNLTFNNPTQQLKGRGTIWTVPAILTKIYKLAAEDGRPIIWLLDDMHIASPAIWSLGYEMFTEKCLRGWPIPSNVAFVLAGNQSIKAGAKPGYSATINRCAVFPVKMSFEYWKKNYAIPKGINSKILSFLSQKEQFAQGEEQQGVPWPSYRAWSRLSTLLTPMEEFYKGNISSDKVRYTAAAHVGKIAAAEFLAYYAIYSKVEVDKIFSGIIPIVIPDNMSDQYIYGMASVGEFFRLYSKNDKQIQSKSLQIMMSIILEIGKKRSEIATTVLKEIVMTENALGLNRIYINIKTAMDKLDPATSRRVSTDINVHLGN